MAKRYTENDIKKIKEEIEYRSLVVRKEALDDVKVQRAQGDLSENFEYKAAKRFKNQNESRIRYLKRILEEAEIIEASNDDTAGVDDLVDIHYEDDNSDERIRLVTSIREDSLKSKISIESPLGKAIFGAKVGDRVRVNLANNNFYEVTIKAITPSSDEGDKISSF